MSRLEEKIDGRDRIGATVGRTAGITSDVVEGGAEQTRAETDDWFGTIGRRLALSLFDHLQPVPPIDNTDPVDDMLRASSRELAKHGVQLQVLRIKQECAVVRSMPFDPAWKGSCPVSKGFLSSIPLLVHNHEARLIETTCITRGGDACLFTMLWGVTAPQSAVPAVEEGAPTAMIELADDRTPEEAPAVVPAEDYVHVDAPPPEIGDDEGPVTFRVVSPVASPRLNPPGSGVYGPTLVPDGPGIDGDLGVGTGEPGAAPRRLSGLSAIPTPLIGAEPAEADVPAAQARRSKLRRPRGKAWMRRRGWMLVLLTAAGLSGGYAAGLTSKPHYVASSILVVRSGANSTGPGGANDAGALAITYAALIPNDESIVGQAAAMLGDTADVVSSSVSATVEAGTSVLVVKFSASTESAAIQGANAMATVLAGADAEGAAIGPNSIAVVSRPVTASVSKGLKKLGLPLGALLGLALGVIAVVAAERADRRVDEPADLSDACSCPASELGGPLAAGELARAVSISAGGREGALSVVALSEEALRGARQLCADLRRSWLRNELEPRRIEVVPAFGDEAAALTESRGPTVVAATFGERAGRASDTARRLDAIGRAPAWAVLVPRGVRRAWHRSR